MSNDTTETTVNPQITDAVTQANVKVLADAPAMAMANIYQSLAQTTGLMFNNAVSAQQQLNVAAQAATVQGVLQIYSVDTITDALATEKISNADVSQLILQLRTALQATQTGK